MVEPTINLFEGLRRIRIRYDVLVQNQDASKEIRVANISFHIALRRGISLGQTRSDPLSSGTLPVCRRESTAYGRGLDAEVPPGSLPEPDAPPPESPTPNEIGVNWVRNRTLNFWQSRKGPFSPRKSGVRTQQPRLPPCPRKGVLTRIPPFRTSSGTFASQLER